MDSIAEPLSAERAWLPGCAGRHTYVRRQPEQTVLPQVVRAHIETFLAEARLRGGGDGLPRFVERELREFLTCGVMARGFARFRCDGCKREILVAFSCKGGICPSCCARLRLLATIEDRDVVEKILTHLGLPVDPPRPVPPRTPAWLPGVRGGADHEDHGGGDWVD